MRVKSIAETKGKYNNKVSGLPEEGSMLKKLYDLFYLNKGTIVNRNEMNKIFNNSAKLSVGFRQLKDFYGCDIRNDTLVGEWCGKVYLDYTKEAVEKFNSEA